MKKKEDKEKRVGWLTDLAELTKLRLTLLVLVTTAAGYFMGCPEPFSFIPLLHIIIGMALVSGGGSTLNEFIERDADKKMHRTQNRPIPSGRISPFIALTIGIILSLGGLLYIYWMVNPLATSLTFSSLILYVLIYTPLKKITSLNTIIGAIPGALPPLIGWVAINPHITFSAMSLFLILFLWQMPHFLAIAWLYREDYQRANFKMLPLTDLDGKKTSLQSLLYAGVLLPASLLPSLFGSAGIFFFSTALILGISFLFFVMRFYHNPTNRHAKNVFFFSIIYLPILLAALILNKL